MVIGITGGIGSGKSLFASYLHNYIKNSLLIMTDDLAKEQQKIGRVSYKSIIEVFGNEILDENLNIDSKKLGSIVFKDKEKLKLLNKITHPNVKKELENIIKNNKEKIIIIESALLFESNLNKICNITILVQTPLNKRIQLLIKKRGYSEEKALQVINNQGNYEQYVDYIIENDTTEKELECKAQIISHKI